MITRSKKQFIVFSLLITAIGGWCWYMLEEPHILFYHGNMNGYMGEQRWLRGHYLLGQIQLLVNQLTSLSEIGAVLLIGFCFSWLAYQSIYYSGSSPMENVNQRIRK